MVEKHRMIADFEQLTYTPEMLRKEWDKQVDHFESLIASGWTNKGVVDLIEYIRHTNYAETFFPGSSIGTLLISKPEDGKLNYQQTLAISVDNQTNKIFLEYTDWDTIDKEEDWKRTVLWSAECLEGQLEDKFKEFIEWNKKWL
jgi:hypothetical protein